MKNNDLPGDPPANKGDTDTGPESEMPDNSTDSPPTQDTTESPADHITKENQAADELSSVADMENENNTTGEQPVTGSGSPGRKKRSMFSRRKPPSDPADTTVEVIGNETQLAVRKPKRKRQPSQFSIRTWALTKNYGTQTVVNRLSVTLSPGEVFGLLGPNGAGKTTTILMLLGLVAPTAGRVEVLGLDPTRYPLEVKRRVGYLPDAVGFYPQLTGVQNLRFTGQLNRLSGKLLDDRIEQLLIEVGLSDAGKKKTGTYSRGMLQRLGIADALLKHPRVLILDEPTTAIDPEGVAEILDLIRKLAKERGVTVLLSSHLLHQVQAVCDRVAIFVEGKVVALGSPHELSQRSEAKEQVEIEIERKADPKLLLRDWNPLVDLEPGRYPGSWVLTINRGHTKGLVATLVEKGAPPIKVNRITDSLDEVYRSFFQSQSGKNGESAK